MKIQKKIFFFGGGVRSGGGGIQGGSQGGCEHRIEFFVKIQKKNWGGRSGGLGGQGRCNQRTNGPVNTHLISWPSKAQNIQNLDNIW